MGCCQGHLSTSEAEEFVMDGINQMKISSLRYEEILTKLEGMTPIKDTLTKKECMLGIKEISNAGHYEIRIFNDILKNFSEKFTISDLMFYLIAFLNFRSIEDSNETLYNQLCIINKQRRDGMTSASLQKLLIDYLSFYTIRLNNIFLSKLSKEHKSFESELLKLETIYNNENINAIVASIIGERPDDETINLISFKMLNFKFNLCSIYEIRQFFTIEFGK